MREIFDGIRAPMLRDQLERLKETRRSMHSEPKRRVVFGDTGDLDDETILELVPVKTPFTHAGSLRFDRQRQTPEEEERFNAKFSGFLKGLVRHGNTEYIEYLLDYLTRRYLCDTFNRREMIFLLLPFKKYYGQVVALSSGSEFNYFCMQKTYSYQFIGNLCVRDKYFFDFFVGYFEYFSDVRDFCVEVLKHVTAGIRNSGEDFTMQFFEIISSLVGSGERAIAAELFFEIREHAGEAVEEFVGMLECFFSREYLVGSRGVAAKTGPVEAIPHDDEELFRQKYDRMEDRGLLGDARRYRNYITWLFREKLPLRTIREDEFGVLKTVCGLSEHEGISGRIEDYFSLFVELAETIGLVEILNRRFPHEIHLLIPYMKDSDKIYLSGLSPSLFDRLVTESNYLGIVKGMSRTFLRDNLGRIMRTCLRYVDYDPSVFLEHLDREMVLTLVEEDAGDTFVGNVIATARAAGIDLSGTIVHGELYSHPGYLDYLSEESRNLGVETDRKIFSKVADLQGEGNIASLCRYLQRMNDPALINEVVGWVVDRTHHSPVLYQSLRRHIEILSMESCERILECRGVREEVYFVLDRLYSIRQDVVDGCLDEKQYKGLLFLCRRHGFARVLGDRRNQDVVEFVVVTSGEDLTGQDAEEFVSYVSSLITYGKDTIINVLLKDRFIPHLMKCSGADSWDLIKIILSESILQHDKYTQCCFDYFIENYLRFENDLDLLNVITQNEVCVEHEKLVELFLKSPGSFKAEVMEILLENTSFDPLRFIPLVVPAMIEHKKRSLGVILNRYGNIMGCYVRDILIHLPEVEDDMMGMDSRYLITGSIDAYRHSQDSHHLEFLCRVLSAAKVISPHMFETTAQFLEEHVSAAHTKLLAMFFKSYLETHRNSTASVRSLLNTVYRCNKEAFFMISNAGFSQCHSLFQPHVEVMIEKTQGGDKDATEFLTNYLYWDAEYSVPHFKLFSALFELYLADPDTGYAKCMGSILRHGPKHIESANEMILEQMKGDRIVVVIELLQVLYQKVYEFRRCLARSSPHFALVVDSTRKDVARAGRRLLGIIERKHKKTGYQLLSHD